MKVRTGGKTIEISGDRLRGRHQLGAGNLGAMHERRDSGTNTSLVKSMHRTNTPTNGLPGWPDPTKNSREKWNHSFAMFLEGEKQAGRIKHWWYEAFSLWLPGQVRFKPDFLIQYPDGLEKPLHFVEVKGWSRNLRDGITRYKIAAALFPCFTWSMVKRSKGGWEEYK